LSVLFQISMIRSSSYRQFMTIPGREQFHGDFDVLETHHSYPIRLERFTGSYATRWIQAQHFIEKIECQWWNLTDEVIANTANASLSPTANKFGIVWESFDFRPCYRVWMTAKLEDCNNDFNFSAALMENCLFSEQFPEDASFNM
jgi:hypothetical protein